MAMQLPQGSLSQAFCNMINLIPPEGHRLLKREYLLRVSSTFLVLLGFLVLVLASAHIPAYVLVDSQMQVLDTAVEKEGERKGAVEEVEEIVKRSSVLVGRLKSSPSQSVETTAILGEIQKHALQGISLETFQIQNTGVVLVQGVAATREVLAQFKASIESSDLFLKAEVPISDLARDTKLPFGMTITRTP